MLVLDTQAWVWWASQSRRLARPAKARIEQADRVAISSVSVMEAAYAVKRGRLELDRPLNPWLDAAIDSVDRFVIPFDAALAVSAGGLDWTHGDPMDRAIVSTAMGQKAAVVSSDRKIQSCGLLEVIWK